MIQEAYVQGISTRSVDGLVKAMGMEGISKSQVSRLCGEIDERVQTFLRRWCTRRLEPPCSGRPRGPCSGSVFRRGGGVGEESDAKPLRPDSKPQGSVSKRVLPRCFRQTTLH